jgi:hypothetical protein
MRSPHETRRRPALRLSPPSKSLIAKAIEPVQDGRIHIEKINEPLLYKERGTPTEYRAGIRLTIERGWLWMHENGTYVKVTQTGAELLAS